LSAVRRLIVEPLGRHHDRAGFSCGVQELDGYFARQAGQDTRRRIATVFVIVDEDKPSKALGFYTLSAITISARELPEKMARKLPRHPLSAALIGRLAIDLAEQGAGLGASLIMDAVSRALAVSAEVAIFAIVVDAKDEDAKRFYQHFGIRSLAGGRHRLFWPLTPIAKDLRTPSSVPLKKR